MNEEQPTVTADAGAYGMDGAADASSTDASTVDGGACPARGRLVEGVSPLPLEQWPRALTAERELYELVTRNPACYEGLEIARTPLALGRAATEHLCVREADGRSRALDYSGATRQIVIAGASRVGGVAAAAFASADDLGWTTSPSAGAAQNAFTGTYPDPDSGGMDSIFAAVNLDADSALVAGAGVGGAVTILFRRGEKRSLSSTARFEPRFGSFSDIQRAADGGVWVAGITTDGQTGVLKLTVLNELDVRSEGGGFVPLGGVPGGVSIGVDAAGRAVLAVAQPTGMVVHRLLPSGAHDSSFGEGGIARPPLGPGTVGRFLIVERSGSVILGGDARDPDGRYRRGGIIRLDAKGALDPDFAGPGRAVLFEPGAPTDMDLQPDGVGLVSAPPGECEGEFAAIFSQRGGKIHLFH